MKDGGNGFVSRSLEPGALWVRVTWPLTKRHIFATFRNMRQSKWFGHRSTVAVAALMVGASFGVFCIRDASSEPMVADGAPSGMVAFVAGGVCPPGWNHVSDLEGRALVGTVTTEDVGIEVGTPFTDGEKRVHHHDYTIDIDLGAKFLAASNAPTGTAASAKVYSVTDVTDDHASELPFFQMEACVKP